MMSLSFLFSDSQTLAWVFGVLPCLLPSPVNPLGKHYVASNGLFHHIWTSSALQAFPRPALVYATNIPSGITLIGQSQNNLMGSKSFMNCSLGVCCVQASDFSRAYNIALLGTIQGLRQKGRLGPVQLYFFLVRRWWLNIFVTFKETVYPNRIA